VYKLEGEALVIQVYCPGALAAYHRYIDGQRYSPVTRG
jgi:hypothetical protein